ncbi:MULTISPECIES: nucleotidyltransferase family protein [Clostridium]|uniref:nucleotidyltransferase family protein n=1 Tax=Clostridium TaxID=1485 RepID=UPI0012E68570|nr:MULTISPECIES: nucleotidyltransferase family protein [Clostridium]MBS4780777.1 nucleotidyltransferase family protein [Clostridium sp.]CAI3629349.1 Nucleotidyltransferase [Clostridium neonatale]SUQ53180.1 UTP--glucose-1-phosphate uridylyltransferase [Clostridium neonatale]
MKELFIDKSISIKQVIKKIDETGKKILLVTTKEDILLGTITDGDVRRWILKNGNLEKPASEIMNKDPIVLCVKQKYRAKKVINEKCISALPIVNEKNIVVDIIFWNEKYNEKFIERKISNPVVIMAGGKGTRLYPYTKILPKPLIPIGEESIIERIIDKFIKFGCEMFYVTVNYKKNMIKAYLGEIQKNYSLEYIEEERFLGTGGSLSLLRGKIKESFFVTNCDVLVEADYKDLLKYHNEQDNMITMVTSLKNYNIPYGVIKLNDFGRVIDTIEKPEFNYLVNAGLYVLKPECIYDIPQNKFFHITDLINKYIKEGKKVGTYPITENAWLDMGEFKEMERMREKLGIYE